MKKLEIPSFQSKTDLFDFMIANKSTLIAQKMSVLKHADGLAHSTPILNQKGEVLKADNVSLDANEIQVKAIINTTNIMDSHKDVHIPGLWTKSLKENKRLMHIQEHKSHEFSSIISSGDDLKAYVKTMTWKSLGYDVEGSTQALVFDSTVKRERNPYMFDQYSKGYVNNHSVGMRYVKIFMAIDDERYEDEKAVWDKYYPEIINKEMADASGVFWAVTEAKAVEGSAVPMGSNPITPTQSIKREPSKGTPPKAVSDTFNISEAIKNINLKI